MNIPNLFKENRFKDNILRIKLRKNLKDTPSKILKILREEIDKTLEKRKTHGNK